MPLVSWGNSSGGDYSQGFAYLARSAELEYESNAKELDNKRLADQAAIDAHQFDLFNAGKLTGDELLAYIHHRIKATAYDKTQQETWKKALLQYGQSIADTKANDAYAATGNINALISYYRRVQAGAAKGTPRYDDAAQKIQQLTTQRDSTALQSGAALIQAKIANGSATNKDLLAFYRSHLRTISDPNLRASIQTAIAQTQGSVRQDQTTKQVSDLQTKLQAHSITPQQYATQLTAIASEPWLTAQQRAGYLNDASTMMRTVQDTQLVTQGKALIAGNDPGSAAYIQGIQLLQKAANDYLPFDPSQYASLTNEIWNAKYNPAQPSNPALPGGPVGGTYAPGTVSFNQNKVGGVSWISQMDGSAYANTNCVMASGAMLAASLGYKGLTGADLRLYTGDTTGGTNFTQLQSALSQAGVDTSRFRSPSGWSFDRFKQAIANGSGAVLGGPYVNLPNSITDISGAPRNGGHGVYIASYDPKKGFLLLDPAVSQNSHPDYKGVWISEGALRNFYDASGGSQYHGLLLTQPHTIGNPNIGNHSPRVPSGTYGSTRGHGNNGDVPQHQHHDNQHHDNGPIVQPHRGGVPDGGQDHPSTPPPGGNHTGGPAPTPSFSSGPGAEDHPTPITFISVDTPPNDPNTPKDWATLTSPGPQGNSRGLQRAQGMDSPPIPLNGQQAQVQYDAFTKRLDLLKSESAAWNAGKTDYNGIPLTPEVMKAVDHEILTGVDYMTGLQKGMGNFGNADTLQNYKTNFIADQVQRNTDQQENLWNQNMAVWADKAQAANLLTDPNQRYAALTKIRDGMAKFIDLASKSNPNDPLSGIDQQAPTQHGFSIAQMKATLDVMDIAIDPKADPAQQKVALLESAKTLGVDLPGSFKGDGKTPGDAVGQVLAITQGFTEDKHLVDTATGTPIVIGGQLTVVPLVDTTRMVNGVATTIQVPDLSGLPKDKNPGNLLGDQLPNVVVQTAQGPRAVPGVPQIDQSLEGLIVLQKDDPALQGLDKSYAAKDGLTTATISTLGPAKVAQLVAQGVIKAAPLPGYFTLTTPDSVGLDGRAYSGTVWHQDPHSNGWVAGSLPIASHSDAIPGVTNYVGVDPTGTPDIKYGPYATQHEVVAPLGAGVPPSQAQYLMDHGWTDAAGVHHDLGHLTANADGTGNFVDAPLDANGNPLPDPNLSREGGMYYTPMTDRAGDSGFDPTGFAQAVADKIAARVKSDQAAADQLQGQVNAQQSQWDMGRYGEELPPADRGFTPQAPYQPLTTGITQPGAPTDQQARMTGGYTPPDLSDLSSLANSLGIKTPGNTQLPTPGYAPPQPNAPTPGPAPTYSPLPTPTGPITQPSPSNWRAQNPPNPTSHGRVDERSPNDRNGPQPKAKPYVPPPPPQTRKTTGGVILS